MNTPVLPVVWVMQLGLQLGWSVVLATLGALVAQRWSWRMPVLRWLPWVLAAWAWVPGSYGPSYWLGLAFQAPSVASVLLCAAWWMARWVTPAQRLAMAGDAVSTMAWAVLGVLLGWVLLLDTLALLPVQWYAWGFSPVAPAVVFLVTMLPWVVWHPRPGNRVSLWLVPLAVGLFVLLRLPSGNLWDALLDPLLWLVLQGYVLRRLWFRYR